MANTLGTSPSGYTHSADATAGAWVANSFTVADGGTITKLRFYQPIADFATTVGTTTLTAQIWHSGNASGQTVTIPLTDTVGFVEAVLPTEFVVADGESFGVEYQIPAGGHYVSKAGALPLTANGITIAGGDYRDGGGDHMTTSNNTALITNTTSYGLDVEVASTPLDALTLTATRTDDTHVSLAWDDADATIVNGVSIVRAPGDQAATLDGNGVAPGAEGYDPTTITGTSIVAENVTVSPHADTVPTAGVYTYWINRSVAA